MFESIVVPRHSQGRGTAPEQSFSFTDEDFSSIKSERDLLQRHHDYLVSCYKEGYSVHALLEESMNFTDAVLSKIYERHGLRHFNFLCLLAVSGYGRGELFPGSDIDIMVSSKLDPIPEEASEKLEKFLSHLWDLKIDLGPSVRTIKETILAQRSDITIKTNLLETRYLAGSHTVYRELIATIKDDDYWNAERFIKAKNEEQTERYHAYKDTSYYIEPDVKNNPGGLRDLQVIQWIANLAFNARNCEEMFKAGLLTTQEYDEYIECRDFLFEVRFAVHSFSNGNRLVLDLQKNVASLLGYGDEGNKPVENMMRALFRTFRRVRELNTIVLQLEQVRVCGHIGDNYDPVFLDSSFVQRGTLIDVIDPELFINDPVKFIDLFLMIAKTPSITGVHFNCLRVLRVSRRQMQQHLIELPQCRTKFRQMLEDPDSLTIALSLMHKTRVLATYMPQWERIEGLMQFDMFHQFSVDEHIICALRNLHDLSESKDPKYALFKTIYKSLSEPVVLTVAALLHDIAKGREGHHSEEGAKDAATFCQLHGFPQYQTELVSWLVATHLLFSNTAQRRDITDPEVIEKFAILMHDEEHLNLLYCLTVADITATNDREWSSWKENIFRQLYFSTRQSLRGEQDSDLRQKAQKIQQEVIESTPDFKKDVLLRHFAQLPTKYFAHYQSPEIRWHARNILRFGISEKPLILFAQLKNVGTELMIYHRHNNSMFFGSVALSMAQKKLNVLSAQIFLTHDGHILSTIIFQSRKGQNLDNERLNSLRESIIEALDRTPELGSIPSAKNRIFNVPTKVRFLSEESKYTSLEISTLDTPGLLAKIGITFGNCGCLISTARITTTGERADDFFAITDTNGLPLESSKKEELSLALMKALEDKKVKR